MAIAKGASVIVNRGGVERRGTVLREVASHIVQGINPGETEATKRYEVDMPEHGGLPAGKDVFSEYELRPVLRDSRMSS